MTSTDVVPWGEQFVGRAEARRQRRRESRRFWGRMAACATIVFASALLAVAWMNRPPGEAHATEIVEPPASTTLPVAPEWATTSTALVPESVPTSTAPLWVQVRVTMQTPAGLFDGLGKVVTDGVRDKRVLPGEPGIALISVPADPSIAATVIVGEAGESVEWRVFNRGQVAANNRGSLTDKWPIVPVVVVVSSLPGDARPYIEARR